jgi:hypothetical protein
MMREQNVADTARFHPMESCWSGSRRRHVMIGFSVESAGPRGLGYNVINQAGNQGEIRLTGYRRRGAAFTRFSPVAGKLGGNGKKRNGRGASWG